ncbi:unnamed protein product [Cuscuta europaea]|uniref:Uncharacterized protein n=1 Tax=Cuscuta europaea TaxID=41803 RepID=A0A9P0ZHA0_CUSEU|nr:unnamed protein product [Cuscuta europaea]
MTTPRNRASWIENLEEDTITTHPETGIIYRDYKGVKRILLLKQIHKYSDGTLKIIEEHLEEAALKVKNSENPDDPIQIDLIGEFAEAIGVRLDFRRTLRHCEVILG